MEKIVLIQLNRVQKRLLEKDITLSWTHDVLEHLAKEGYDPTFGARPLKRLIQQTVVNMLSSAILKGEIENGNSIELRFVENTLMYQKLSRENEPFS
jgi:ATP-dependent Clp protease ATP-binding subunit ClpB